MLKKIFFVSILSVSTLFAFQIDEKLDATTVQELGLTKDKIYILDFFASWCVSCKIELPLISKLNNQIDQEKYKIIGIDVDKDLDKGKAFVEKLQLNFDIYYDNKSQLISKFNPIGVPAIYYIKDLKIQKVIYGAVHNIDKKIAEDIKKLREL